MNGKMNSKPYNFSSTTFQKHVDLMMDIHTCFYEPHDRCNYSLIEGVVE